jgi:hypothetical protein
VEWLEQLMLAASLIAVVSLLIAGVTFAMVLYVSANPRDPSEGRGRLAGRAE